MLNELNETSGFEDSGFEDSELESSENSEGLYIDISHINDFIDINTLDDDIREYLSKLGDIRVAKLQDNSFGPYNALDYHTPYRVPIRIRNKNYFSHTTIYRVVGDYECIVIHYKYNDSNFIKRIDIQSDKL